MQLHIQPDDNVNDYHDDDNDDDDHDDDELITVHFRAATSIRSMQFLNIMPLGHIFQDYRRAEIISPTTNLSFAFSESGPVLEFDCEDSLLDLNIEGEVVIFVRWTQNETEQSSHVTAQVSCFCHFWDLHDISLMQSILRFFLSKYYEIRFPAMTQSVWPRLSSRRVLSAQGPRLSSIGVALAFRWVYVSNPSHRMYPSYMV